MKALGHVFKYGDNVDTDVIIPARYLNSYDAQELASHAMADIDPEFVNKVQPGDIIVANKNFGCGSSREHAPLCLKTAGVSCVIAETFARIFYRNAINIGLPIIECPEAAKAIEAGDEVEIDFDSGKIYDRTKGTEFKGQPFPEFMQKLIAAGGLVKYTNFCGWNYEANSPLRDILKEILKRQGVEMETEASHGGMETGILKGLIPDLDIITYGPIAEGCHTPEEKLNLESFQKAYKNLCDLIAEL